MQRDLKFDIARCLCMFWVIGLLHLSQYLGEGLYLYDTVIGSNITWGALGVFSLVSGYFIGQKYIIGTWAEAWHFYKRRLVRFYPLFALASLVLAVIGFNSWKGTLCSLVGITAFVPVEYRVSTTWYMAMLLCLYAVTPLVSRRNMSVVGGGKMWMIMSLTVVILFYVFHGMDSRFPYNMLLYYIGIIAGHNTDKFLKILGMRWLQVVSIIVYAFILIFSVWTGNKMLGALSWIVGVWAILSLSVLLEMCKRFSTFYKVVLWGAYGSMAYYLFHRFFYWLATEHISLSSEWMFLYLFIIVFPIGWIVSYRIQKTYDTAVSKL